MSSRIFSVGLAVLLTACGGPPDSVAPGDSTAASTTGSGTPAEAPVERIACAIGSADYADVCTIDRVATRDGQLVTVRHPDGGFRRFLVSADGRDVSAADGALPVETLARDDRAVEVAVGNARYRLPPRRSPT